MRKIAKKEFRLSEYDLTDNKGIIITIRSEKEVFDILEIDYVPSQLQ